MEQAKFIEHFGDKLHTLGISPHTIPFGILFVIIIFASYFIHLITKRYFLKYHMSRLRFSSSEWSKLILSYSILEKLYFIVPVLSFYLLTEIAWYYNETFFEENTIVHVTIERVVTVLFIFIITNLLTSVMNVLNHMYKKSSELAARIPMRGYIDFLKLVLWIIAGLLAITTVTGSSIGGMLAGLGAVSALVLLIFKDSILGFISNIQVSAYDVIRIGDHIEIPSYNITGIVSDITLNFIKIQNFDKTMSTVATYDVLTKSLKNWRNMYELGGRLINRSLNIDVNSLKFCELELLKEIAETIPYMKEYIEKSDFINKAQKEQEIQFRVTNSQLFIYYITQYLKNRSDIISNDKQFSFMIRYLEFDAEKGLPLEIYVFTNNVRQPMYDMTQTEIFDHLFVMLSKFQLLSSQRN